MPSTTSNSPAQTEQFGQNLAANLNGGDVLLLSGELGAGKTSLVKGIAKGLDIDHTITSPTFTLMNVYEVENPTIKTFVHVDTYRLKDENELLEIGIEDYLGQPNTVCIIEWPEKIAGLLKNKQTTSIHLEHGSQPEERKIRVS